MYDFLDIHTITITISAAAATSYLFPVASLDFSVLVHGGGGNSLRRRRRRRRPIPEDVPSSAVVFDNS